MRTPLSRTLWWAHRRVSNGLFRAFRHRIYYGTIPDWTAQVGREWQPLDEGGRNLYNTIWRVQHWIRPDIR